MLGGARDPQLRRGRAGAAREGLPRPRAEGGVAASSRPTGSSARCSPRAPRSRRRPTASSTRTSRGCSSGAAHGVVGRRHPAARRGARAARRAAARLRARDRRRGAGPDADAAAHGRAPRARRRADDPRRRRAGDRRGSLLELGRGAAAPAARRRGDGRGAAPRLPRAARDHGASRCRCSTRSRRTSRRRSPTARAPTPPTVRRVDAGAPARGGLPRGRAARRAGRAARGDRPRGARRRRAAADDLWDGVPRADAARGEGARVRPRRRRRAGADRAARAVRRADAGRRRRSSSCTRGRCRPSFCAHSAVWNGATRKTTQGGTRPRRPSCLRGARGLRLLEAGRRRRHRHHRHEELPGGVHPRPALQAGARGEGLHRQVQGEHRLDRADPRPR